MTERARRRILGAGALLAGAAALLLPFAYLGSFAGDAQVHLVFAENAAHGHFFTFNPGERVAGETSPGYMLLGAAAFRLFSPSTVPIVLKVVCLLSWYALLYLVFGVAARCLRDRGRAAGATLAVALMPGCAYNATIGMENGLFAAVIWLWVALIARWHWSPSERAPREPSLARELALGAVLGAACWLRPEGFIVAAIAYAYRTWIGGMRGWRSWTGVAACATLAFGVVLFQFIETEHWVATSVLSRRLLAQRHSLRLGPLFIDPTLALRLAIYWPLSVAYLLSLRAADRSPFEHMAALVLAAFFLLFTFGTGAAHLARYMIFLVPVLAIGAARAVRELSPTTIAIGAGVLLMVYAGEAVMRRRAYSQDLLRDAITAPGTRKQRTGDLLARLGHTGRLPAVLAYESVQARYELDDRVIVRSLDGRVDRELLDCVEGGAVNVIRYLKIRQVDYLMELPPYDIDRPPWDRIRSLAPGEAVELDGVRLSRLRGLAAYAVTLQ